MDEGETSQYSNELLGILEDEQKEFDELLNFDTTFQQDDRSLPDLFAGRSLQLDEQNLIINIERNTKISLKNIDIQIPNLEQ